MKYKGLSFYLNETPSLKRITEYHQYARERRKVYEYVERYGQLPVSAMVGEHWSQEEDRNMHYSAKVASVATPGRIDEFIRGEIRIFKHRLDQTKNECVVRFFVEEYLSRLQESFLISVSENNDITITIDAQNRNWVGPEKKNDSRAQSIIKTLNKNVCKVVVVSHFTHHASVKDKITGGVLSSEIEGIKSILCRTFEDLLRCTTSALYVSGMVEKKYAIEEGPSPRMQTALEEKHLPQCMKEVVRKLYTDRHLKYEDRSNFANFLKNIGVPLDEAVSLFKKHFKCPESEFDKEYKYRIRHVYGKEGSKIDYKNTLCIKIIKETGSTGCTGCPFAQLENSTQACARDLSTKTGKPEEPVVSPVEYYLKAKSSSLHTS
ncbi:DNA primase large subunit [Nematocida sp. AWRm77]|nr:DNA primase large subunit [Nematocida sp. AWRm77]